MLNGVFFKWLELAKSVLPSASSLGVQSGDLFQQCRGPSIGNPERKQLVGVAFMEFSGMGSGSSAVDFGLLVDWRPPVRISTDPPARRGSKPLVHKGLGPLKTLQLLQRGHLAGPSPRPTWTSSQDTPKEGPGLFTRLKSKDYRLTG